ncbi:hypothetical protein [Streptococcus equinus]|uniref:hypothetical protein n=1 Tax=Streptococcus equinus TaxID=1335 RepID=UPI00051B3CDA|nr:hypothetical protein [Streptococcus equinus]
MSRSLEEICKNNTSDLLEQKHKILLAYFRQEHTSNDDLLVALHTEKRYVKDEVRKQLIDNVIYRLELEEKAQHSYDSKLSNLEYAIRQLLTNGR